MSAKSSILRFSSAMPSHTASARTEQDRRPTDAEKAYVRAIARHAAQAFFETEQQGASPAAPKDEVPCE